jgi:hypothetical protein
MTIKKIISYAPMISFFVFISFVLVCIAQGAQVQKSNKDVREYVYQKWIGESKERKLMADEFNKKCIEPLHRLSGRTDEYRMNPADCAKINNLEEVYQVEAEASSVIKDLSWPSSAIFYLVPFDQS